MSNDTVIVMNDDNDLPNAALPVQVLTFAQEVTVLCLGWVSASFSIAGSSCLLYLLYGKTGGQLRKLDTLGRLLLGLSTCDIVHSFGMLWQGLLLPADSSPRRRRASGW